MFDRIAGRYDRVNTVMTAGIDALWRRLAVDQLRVRSGAELLDLCCGTGALARAAVDRIPGCRVTGVDFSRAMLAIAQRRKGSRKMRLLEADVLHLPFPDGCFDGATMGFSMRNVVDIAGCLRETARVLRPGSRFVNLELSRPRNRLWRRLFFLYFYGLVPLIGRLIGGDAAAYRYLPQSLVNFPSVTALAELFQANGFADVACMPLMGGVATLHVGTKAVVAGAGKMSAVVPA